ncbi:MAG TPA: hypothetical protein VK324_14825 [Tepidisphaeraceae bacterium]|nr:hypothetical protein [Tepidisphaeraceae bacterium]
MNHCDAHVSEVTVVIKQQFPDTAAAAEELKKAFALEVSEVNEDQGVVVGLIDSGKVHDLQKHPQVEYARVGFSYVADYPTGDPRDLDGPGT